MNLLNSREVTRTVSAAAYLRPCLFLAISIVFISQAAHAAKPGTITGAIKSKPSASTFEFPHIVTAYEAEPPFKATSILVPSGKFKLQVAPGFYVVLISSWRGDSLGYKTTSQFVTVNSAAATSLNSRAKKILAPNGPVISVGNVQVIGPDGQPLKQVNGTNITFDGILDSAMVGTSHRCPFHVGADREFGNFKQFEKELKRRAKKEANPKTRQRLKKSLAMLPLWAPQYRLTGTIAGSSQGASFVDANLQIVDLATGKIVWCKRITFAGGLLFGNFPQTIAAEIADRICGKTDMPKSIQGDFTGKTEAGTIETWKGKIKFVPSDADPLHGKPAFLGVGEFSMYIPASVNVSEWRITGGNACTVDGTTSGDITDFSGAAMFVEVTPEGCDERRYGFASSFSGPTSVTLTFNCGGTITQSPGSWSASLFSEPEIPSRSKFSKYTAVGDYAEGNSSWTWNMTVTPP